MRILAIGEVGDKTGGDKTGGDRPREHCMWSAFEQKIKKSQNGIFFYLESQCFWEYKETASYSYNFDVIFSSPCQRQCELLLSLVIRRLLTFHILIFSSETP
jgi:hypothetical protein